VNWLDLSLERESAGLGSLKMYSARDESVDAYIGETIAKLKAEHPLRLKTSKGITLYPAGTGISQRNNYP